MGKIKNILKKVSGGLKMAAVWAPAVIGIGGFLTMLGGGIAAGVYENRIKDYREDPTYLQIYFDDVKEATVQHEGGEISDSEYYEKLSYLDSNKYLMQVAESQSDNEELQATLKSYEAGKIAAYTGIGSAVAGLVLSGIWYVGSVSENIRDSAESDFDYAENQKWEEERRKRLKELEEEERKKKEAEPKDEFEETENEDDNLPNIEDSYYKE